MHFGVAVRRPGAPPAPEVLRRLVAERVRVAVPALAYRLVGKGRRARWEPDPEFDPGHHLEFHRMPLDVGVHQAVLDAMRVRPLARDRPLWSLMVLRRESDQGEEHVLCYRAHHVFQDGMGIAGAARALLGEERLPAPGGGRGAAAYWRSPGPAGRSLAELRHVLGAPPRWFTSRSRAGGDGLRLEVVSLEIAPFHEISRATGASIAQIGLALVTGALHTWNRQPGDGEAGNRQAEGRGVEDRRAEGRGTEGRGAGDRRAEGRRAGKRRRWPLAGRELVIAMPVGLHGHRQHTALGNHTALLPVVLPCGEPSPLARLERIAEQTTIRRIGHARQAARELYALPAAVAVPLLRLVAPLIGKGSPRRLSVTAVPLPGEFAGGDEVFAVPGLPPGIAGMVVITPAGPRVTVSAVFDPRVARSGELLGLVRQELTRLREPATR